MNSHEKNQSLVTNPCIQCGRQLSKGWKGIVTTYSCNNPDCIKQGLTNLRPAKIVKTA